MFCCHFGDDFGAMLVPFWCRFGADWGVLGGGVAFCPFLCGPGGVQGRPLADKARQIQGRGAFSLFYRTKIETDIII